MRYRRLSPVSLVATVFALVTIVPAAAGQTPKVPRTAWGKPDLQGIWDFRTLTPLERPTALAGKPFLTPAEAAEFEKRRLSEIDELDVKEPADIVGNYNQVWFDRGSTVVGTRRTSLIIDPPDGRLPALTPEARKRADSAEAARIEASRRGDSDTWEDLDASDRCIQHSKAGPPINPGAYNNNIHLFQTADYVAILNEQIHDTRLIPLDGRPHLGKGLAQWMGDSRGRWEGDTLVVETTNFNGKHDQVGRPVLESGKHLRLVERFTRVDGNTLRYEYTVTDPTVWVAPWTAQFPMKLNPDLMYEYACHEGNYSMKVRLAGAREREKAGSKKESK